MAFKGVETADSPDSPLYGLFSVAEVHNRGSRDEYWISGFFVESESCGVKTDGLPVCTSDPNDPFTIFDNSTGERFFHVAPFGILETYQCDNSIGYNAIDRRATVVSQLERVTEYAVEKELWYGQSAQVDNDPIPANRYLTAATDVTSTPGSAEDPVTALGLVEQAFAFNNPGIRATIHMTPLMANALGNKLEDRKDQLVVENTGSLVAINRASDGSDSAGSASSSVEHWIYATGPVHVDLGSEELITVSSSESVNPTTNQVIYTAERPVAVYFDGCSWYGALADATL